MIYSEAAYFEGFHVHHCAQWAEQERIRLKRKRAKDQFARSARRKP